MLRLAPRRIERLALISSQARPDSPSTTARRRTMLALSETENGIANVISRQLSLLLHPSRVPPGWAPLRRGGPGGRADEASELSLDALRYPEAAAVVEMAQATSVRDFGAQQEAIMSRGDARATLREYAASPAAPRVLVLCGAEDSLIPRRAAEEMFEVAAGAALRPGMAAYGPHRHHRHRHHHHAAGHSRHEGGSDAAAPAVAALPGAELARPNVAFVAVPGAGHLVTLEEPGVVTAELLHWMEESA